MSSRPKRIISKPPRYMSTSSEDNAPIQKRTTIEKAIGAAIGDIDDDINDMRNALHENDNYDENPTFSNNNNTNTNNNNTNMLPSSQRVSSCTDTYTHTAHTDTQYNTDIQSHTNNIQSQTNIQSYGDKHMNSQTFTNSQPYSDTNPYTNFQTCTRNIQPYSTSIPTQTNFQSHTSNNLLNIDTNTINNGANINTGNEFQTNFSRSSNGSNVHRTTEEARQTDRYSCRQTETQLKETHNQ